MSKFYVNITFTVEADNYDEAESYGCFISDAAVTAFSEFIVDHNINAIECDDVESEYE